MYDLSTFALPQMIQSGRELRIAAQAASTMQQGAGYIVDLLYRCFVGADNTHPACALVRCFKTHPYSELPPSLQARARALLGDPEPSPGLRCLTLLASRGDEPDWNAPHTSRSHQVIPLPTAQIVAQAPMIARLVVQLGISLDNLVQPEPGFLLDLKHQTFNVFHVEEAQGSEFVPSQETFVHPHKIRSVLGFGGLLPSGELFVIVLFSKVHISRETAALFRTLALSVKLALLPFSNRVFSEN